MVWWSRWSELDGAARDAVDVVWSTWFELDGAAQDVVDVVGARRSCSAARLMARRGSLSGSCGSLVGSAWLAYGLAGSLDGSTRLI